MRNRIDSYSLSRPVIPETMPEPLYLGQEVYLQKLLGGRRYGVILKTLQDPATCSLVLNHGGSLFPHGESIWANDLIRPFVELETENA